MHVTEFTIGSAVLDVFRDLRVFHAGGTLRVETLRDSWNQCGLRARDLEPGIAWLVANGLLVRGSSASPGDATLLSLTSAGSHRISDLPHRFGEWLNAIDAALALASARRRSRRNRFWNRVRCGYHGFAPEQASPS